MSAGKSRAGKKPGPRAEMAAMQAQVDAGYLRACDKYGWKKPARWGPQRMAAAMALRNGAKA